MKVIGDFEKRGCSERRENSKWIGLQSEQEGEKGRSKSVVEEFCSKEKQKNRVIAKGKYKAKERFIYASW